MSHLGEKDFTNRLDYIQAQKNLIQKGLYGGLPCEDIIQKAKKVPIGTVSNGFKKVAEGKWRKVSDSHKMTKEEHEKEADLADTRHVKFANQNGEDDYGHSQDRDMHKQKSKNLDDKEYTDQEKMQEESQNDSGKITKAEDLDIIKGGEGSKGGKVIGHTKSGKPIYESATHASHRNFTSGEHKEAIDLHESKIKTDKGNETTHYNQIDSHHNQLKAKKSKESENDSAETKAFKHNHAAATKEQREHVAESYFGDKKKDLTSVGKHHHEQLSDSLYEKMEADKKAKVKKAEGDVNDGTFDKAMTAEAGEGVTQKESVEHNPKDMQNPKSSDLKKAYEILGLGDLIEKAEGARGGKIIGHTKSGNPIYETKKIGTDSYHKINHKISGDKWISDSHEMDEEQHRQKASFHSEQAHRNQDQPDRLEYHDEQNEDHIKHKRNLEKLNKEKKQ